MGFTLAELLLVVAIIAVLVALSLPVFSRQLERSREAVDLAGIREAYAQAVSEYLGNGATERTVVTIPAVRQSSAGWLSEDAVLHISGAEDITLAPMAMGDVVTIELDEAGAVTVKVNGR